MKSKIKFWVLTTAIVALSSCNSEEDLYDPTKAAELKKAQYEEAFVKKFGKIASNQDWGFGESVGVRGANPNSNQWSDFVVVPGNITSAEKEKVTEWFRTHQNPESIAIDWSDFFIQHVSSSHSNMDKIVAVLKDGKDDHVNNFNASDGQIMLMQKSGTFKFGYNNSKDGKMHYEYTIQYIDGAYYVGFDFLADGTNENQKEAADGYYADWIVKVTPANYKNAKRIMAEDLGEIGDFDFNDVVFDAAMVNSEVVITLQAAGGTLPLYVGSQSDENEVHNRFNVSTTTMVNTEKGKHQEYPPVIFRLKGYFDISYIPIIIDNNGVITTLSAELGKAPGKLCIPNTTTDWSNETENIEIAYPKFKKYVGNPTLIWWDNQ